MNKFPKEFHKNKRFSTFEKGYGDVQIRDKKPSCKVPTCGVVAVIPTLGGQFSSPLDYRGAVTLARKIVKLLNSKL